MPPDTSARSIFLLNGNTKPRSLGGALTDAYEAGARSAGHRVVRIDVADLDFDPDFGAVDYVRDGAPDARLEPDLVRVLEALRAADHVALVTPMWWGGVPAKLKGVFDRVLLPGLAYDPHVVKMGFPRPLLTGRTGRIMLTSDTPDFAFSLLYRRALARQLRGQVFRFVGIKPAPVTHFSPVQHAKPEKIARWIAQAEDLGRKAA